MMPEDYHISELYAQLCSLSNLESGQFNEADKGLKKRKEIFLYLSI
jgi:hypothetical protein